MNMSHLCKVAALAAAAAAPAASLAQEVRPMFKVGFDTGGDKVVTALFTNGSTKSIKANELLFLAGGVSILSDDKNLQAELSLGIKVDSITASNGDIDFTRYPLDALVFYRESHVRVGGGLTYHFSPKVSGSGVAGGVNVNFKDALGVILQADYLIWRGMSVGLRYTILDYKTSSGPARTVNSDGFGIVFSMSF
jgi:opacity protein-like surface antigen